MFGVCRTDRKLCLLKDRFAERPFAMLTERPLIVIR